jgi:L-threonylcarbamoyladenylate synthase
MRRIAIEDLGSPEELFRLRELLGNGGIAAVPTETFYALAADPLSAAGVSRILKAKGREAAKSLPVLFSGAPQLDRLGVTSTGAALQPYLEIWPAPLTVILPIREPIPASLGAKTVAVRIPADRRLRRILESTGPLTGTSANRSGGAPLDDPDAVDALFGFEVDVLVDGGRTPGGKPSTILDATQNPPRVVRAGAFAWAGPSDRSC